MTENIWSFNMTDKQIKNAIILTAELGFIGHGGDFMDIRIQVEYDGGVQGFGGYHMGTRDKASPFLSYVVHGILCTLEIGRWSDLVGQPVRCYVGNKRIEKIGHYSKDKWFSFEDAIKQMEQKND